MRTCTCLAYSMHAAASKLRHACWSATVGRCWAAMQRPRRAAPLTASRGLALALRGDAVHAGGVGAEGALAGGAGHWVVLGLRASSSRGQKEGAWVRACPRTASSSNSRCNWAAAPLDLARMCCNLRPGELPPLCCMLSCTRRLLAPWWGHWRTCASVKCTVQAWSTELAASWPGGRALVLHTM